MINMDLKEVARAAEHSEAAAGVKVSDVDRVHTLGSNGSNVAE